MLWFAWKLVLLQYRKQLSLVLRAAVHGCDLLENSYFCSIANNLGNDIDTIVGVVICLKTRTFAVSQTTHSNKTMARYWLWFAWKLVLLQYRKQLQSSDILQWTRCDLLENSYFCSIANNRSFSAITSLSLWFAWKLVLLQYRKQPVHKGTCWEWRCDLLENSYFCSIANNLGRR